MSARDDLAALVSEVFAANSAHPRYPEQIADAILAAGWQHPDKVQRVVMDLARSVADQDARLQRVRALADGWETRANAARVQGKVGDVRKDNLTLGSLVTNDESCARELRAALDGQEATT